MGHFVVDMLGQLVVWKSGVRYSGFRVVCRDMEKIGRQREISSTFGVAVSGISLFISAVTMLMSGKNLVKISYLHTTREGLFRGLFSCVWRRFDCL